MFNVPALRSATRLHFAQLALTAALGLSGWATAAPKLAFEGSGLLDGVDGLTVNGQTFDVRWQSNRSYDSVYATSPPAALGDPALAEAVAGAIRSAIIDAPALQPGQSWWASGVDCGAYCLVWVPSRYYDNGFGMIAEGSLASVSYDAASQTWASATGTFGSVADIAFPWDAYAVFAVPEPATLWTLALGLGFVGWHRRRRSAQA